jgi:hypothetical protein
MCAEVAVPSPGYRCVLFFTRVPGIIGDTLDPNETSGMPPLAPRTEERAVASPDGRLPAAGYADLTTEHAWPEG